MYTLKKKKRKFFFSVYYSVTTKKIRWILLYSFIICRHPASNLLIFTFQMLLPGFSFLLFCSLEIRKTKFIVQKKKLFYTTVNVWRHLPSFCPSCSYSFRFYDNRTVKATTTATSTAAAAVATILTYSEWTEQWQEKLFFIFLNPFCLRISHCYFFFFFCWHTTQLPMYQ